jgi:hypothetical protein
MACTEAPSVRGLIPPIARGGERQAQRRSERVEFRVRPAVSIPLISFWNTPASAASASCDRPLASRSAVHGQIIKTYSVVDQRPQAAVRYSPYEVIAVERDVVSGLPTQISTSYVERSNLSLRIGIAPLHPVDQWLLLETRQSRRGCVAVRGPLQSVPRSRNPADHAGHRHRRRRPCLVDWRTARRRARNATD